MGRLDDRLHGLAGPPTLHAGSDAPGGGGGKPDFSKVRSGASSSEPKAPKADFSKVRSGGSSTADQPEAPEGESRTYTVKRGDSLSKIAKQVYGDANRWKRIFEANRDQIEDPDLIHPGQVLQIPE